MGSLIGVKSMLSKIKFLTALILIFTASHLIAHEGHKPDTATVVDGDTIAINGIAISDSLKSEIELIQTEKTLQVNEYKLIIGNVLFEHIHNKIIHFPIALTVVGFILAVMGYKDNRYEMTIKVMLLIAGIFGIVAFFSGTNQLSTFDEVLR